MKFKKVILVLTALVVVVASVFFSSCDKKQQPQDGYVQKLDYSESTEKINNPDQGFYRPIYVKVTKSGASYNKNIVNSSTQLYHLRVDISVFSKAVNGADDKPLTPSALSGLDELLSYLKEKDKNAVVRFAYDPSYGGNKDKEPELSAILNHVGQICTVLSAYENTITAIETGLIGPWGEMHSSKIANAANIVPITDAFLSHTSNIPVLVRTPKMIYDYLGITVNDIDGYRIPAGEKAHRLGLYNDGYLGSGSDLGTYTDREREIEFLSGQTDHLPFGGEVVTPASNLHNIETCLPEMFKINLSYLNVEWNNQVIEKWKNSVYTATCGTDFKYYGKSAFTYIENRMGYRFILTCSTFRYTENHDSLDVEITLKNVGFGNLNRTKRAKLLFIDDGGNVVFEKAVNDFTGGENYGCAVNMNLPDGKYDVYLQLFGEEAAGTPLYCLQFANNGLWNAELKANRIGSIEK